MSSLGGAAPSALHWLAVGAGAALGAWGRWMVGLWLNPLWPGFPMGTLAVNVLGGLAIGVALVVFAAAPASAHEGWRLFVMTGLLGGFTTFSAFSAESLALLQRQQWLLAALHSLAHVLLALGAAAAGFALTRWGLR